MCARPHEVVGAVAYSHEAADAIVCRRCAAIRAPTELASGRCSRLHIALGGKVGTIGEPVVG